MTRIIKNQSLNKIIFLVVSLAAVGQITNTIYVPAMSLIAHGLHVPINQLQAVMGAYLLPYGASQFVYGPLSDQFGRKPIILVGLLLFIFGSLIASTAISFSLLLLGSFIQGSGIGVGGVMARTIVRDLHSGRALHKATSTVSTALIVAPLLAPLLGGFLSAIWGWRASFIFLTLFALVVLATQYFLFTETNRFAGDKPLSVEAVKQSYRHILANPQFLAYLACLVATFAGVCIFEATGGILFTHLLHYSTIATSLWFIVPLPFYMLGSYLSGLYARSWSLNRTLSIGVYLLLLGAVCLLLTGLLGWVNSWAIIIPISIYMFAAGILFPAATSGALQPFPELAGTAGALLGGIQNLGAGLCIFISAIIPQTSQLPLGIILSVMAVIVTLLYYLFLWQPEEPSKVPVKFDD